MIELLIGSSLAASAGLNAWMPLFLLGIADRFLPAMSLPAGWSWLSSDVALWGVGILLILEIAADKIPAFDTINDIIQSVLRPAAGGVAFGAGSSAQTIAVDDPAGFFTDNTAISVVIGIGIALVVHIVKAVGRAMANTVTGGLAAPVLSTAEDAASFALSALAIVVPLIAGLALIGLVITVVVLFRRWGRRRRERVVQAV